MQTAASHRSEKTANPEPPSKETLASTVYDQLRQDILTVELPANAKLNIRALCERFSVGLSPVREALSRLSREKQPEIAVEAVRELVRRRLSVRLVVAGDGPLRRPGQSTAQPPQVGDVDADYVIIGSLSDSRFPHGCVADEWNQQANAIEHPPC